MSIIGLLTGGLLTRLGDIAKTFFGSKSERDTAIAEEVKAVQDAYKAELLAPEKLSWWGSFIDGINRLVRPSFTFGIVALFAWAVFDPIEFQVTMIALGLIPDMLWTIMLTILSFWFGGRLLQNVSSIKPLSAKEISVVLEAQKKVAKLDDPVPVIIVPPNPAEPPPVVKVAEPKAINIPTETKKKRVWDDRDER